MRYRKCGNSGLMMSELSLGLWHNFGGIDDYEVSKSIIHAAYEAGITVFDMANNYGPPPGSAEITMGRVLKDGFDSERDKILLTSKAGHEMWSGVYGDWGSRKHVIASCDQSLKRVGVDYFDIFYSHRYDPNTPIEETMGALETIVKSGRALYAGLSKYPVDKLREAVAILKARNVPVIVDQLKYSLLVREPEIEHFAAHKELGLGCVSFSPLAQGLLTDKYLNGIPKGSRAEKESGFLKISEVEQNLDRIKEFGKQAQKQGVSLAHYAINWQLRDDRICSVIVGVSSLEQLKDNLKTMM